MGVLEYRVQWSGGSITGPGVSVHHGRIEAAGTAGQAAIDLANRCRVLWDGLKTFVPTGITWSFPGEVTELDTATGQLEDVHPINVLADVVSSGSNSSWAKPAGGRIDWLTEVVVGGRRLKGRTYVVPLSGAQYDAQGSLTPACISGLVAAASAYRDGGVTDEMQPSVWSRRHGVQGDITNVRVPDRVSILTSRRD